MLGSSTRQSNAVAREKPGREADGTERPHMIWSLRGVELPPDWTDTPEFQDGGDVSHFAPHSPAAGSISYTQVVFEYLRRRRACELHVNLRFQGSLCAIESGVRRSATTRPNNLNRCRLAQPY